MPRSYAEQVLITMGLKPTPGSVAFLNAWAHREGVPQNIDSYNMLGTTLPMGGSHGTNAPGVQAYPTLADGIRATAAMLQQKNFTGIRAALASGNPEAYRNNATVNHEMLSWSGGGYSWPTSGGVLPRTFTAGGPQGGGLPALAQAPISTPIPLPPTPKPSIPPATPQGELGGIQAMLLTLLTHPRATPPTTPPQLVGLNHAISAPSLAPPVRLAAPPPLMLQGQSLGG